MALYAIGDLHLSIGTGKSMEVFGGRWMDYMEKIKAGFAQVVRPEDTVVLCGDVAWGMTLEQAREEFAFINALPGKKIITAPAGKSSLSRPSASSRLTSGESAVRT